MKVLNRGECFPGKKRLH